MDLLIPAPISTPPSPLADPASEPRSADLPLEGSRRATILVAVSGGPDSVALLLAWSAFAGQRGDSLQVATFDHRWRSESAEDVRFVRELAEELGLPVHVGGAEIDHSPSRPASPEEAARDARYGFFRTVARSLGEPPIYVATGHTADDQVETVLHAIVRGSGLAGLTGIPDRRTLVPGVEVVRPLRTLRREEGHRFLAQLGVRPREDRSNLDTRFTRNRVRHELLPMLRERFNPRVDAAVLRLSALAGDWQAVQSRLANELLFRAIVSEDSRRVTLAAEELRKVEPVLAAEAIRLLLDRKGWPRQKIGRAELERVVQLLQGVGPRAWDLPDGLRADVGDEPAVLRITYFGEG